MAHSTNQTSEVRCNVECAIRSRFARGTVLIARHSRRLEFLCKAVLSRLPLQRFYLPVDFSFRLFSLYGHRPVIQSRKEVVRVFLLAHRSRDLPLQSIQWGLTTMRQSVGYT